MKKIVDYCDICKENYETAKCGCCGCSLCRECALTFLIHIGGYEACHHKSFCKNCLPKIQLTKTKGDNKYLREIQKEILNKLDKRIKSVINKGEFKCHTCDLKYMT